MTGLNEHKIKRFRDRLLGRKTARLMHKGGAHNLNPIKSFQTDSFGNAVIETKKIVDFFLTNAGNAVLNGSEDCIGNLYVLFKEFSTEVDEYSFKSEEKISFDTIIKADKNTQVRHLVKNLIITYFSGSRMYSGRIDTSLLDKELKKIIERNASGTDFQPLVDKTGQDLESELKNMDAWSDCMQPVAVSEVICRLVGSPLPKIDPSVLSKFIRQVHQEISRQNQLLASLMKVRKQLAAEQKDRNTFLKALEKFDRAAAKVLQKMDDGLSGIHGLRKMIGTTTGQFLSRLDAPLRKNMALVFWGFPLEEQDNGGFVEKMSYTAARFRMNQLQKYPDLAHYCRILKSDETYGGYYIRLLKSYFREFADIMSRIERHPDETEINRLNMTLDDFMPVCDRYCPAGEDLEKEKQKLAADFLNLMEKIPMDSIHILLENSVMISRIIGKKGGEFEETINQNLLKAGFSSVSHLESSESMGSEIQKILHNSSAGYTPKKFFYRNFFTEYVGKTDASPSLHFEKLTRMNQKAAAGLLEFFSQEKGMDRLLDKKYSECARSMLKSLSHPDS